MYSTVRLDELCQPCGGNGIRHDGSSRRFTEQNSGDGRDQSVFIQHNAAFVYGAYTVYIGIKNQTKIGIVPDHSVYKALHGLGIFGIGNMMWKMPVWLQKLAALNIRPQGLQHLFSIKATGPVAGVHKDFQPFERLGLAGFLLNFLTQPLSIDRNEVKCLHLARPAAGQIPFR